MSTVPAPGRAWWLREAPLDDPLPPLAGDAEADVAVVGGGYCGLWTALALRRRDPALRVVVLEADRCGTGPSGRNGGFLHGYWASIASLRDVFGDAGAVALADASAGAVPAVRALARERGEDVWLREGGMLRVSASPLQDAPVERAVRAAAELGRPEEAVPLGAAELAARCRSPVLRRGVLFRDGATVQPARLVRALRRAALDAGAELHEGTRVTAVRAGDPVVVETPRGRVRARDAVLAVNAAATAWRPLRRWLTNAGSSIVLTEPVPGLLEELGWTGGEAIVDARVFLHYFRTTPDGRVALGSATGPLGLGGRLDGRFERDRAVVERAAQGLRRLLPPLAEARVEAAWGGPIDVSADGFPFVGTRPGTRLHYAAGFSGNGVGPAWLAGECLASLVTDADDAWARLPLVGRRPRRGLPPEPLKRGGGALVRAAILRVETDDEAGRRAPAWARAGAALPRVLGVRLGSR